MPKLLDFLFGIRGFASGLYLGRWLLKNADSPENRDAQKVATDVAPRAQDVFSYR